MEWKNQWVTDFLDIFQNRQPAFLLWLNHFRTFSVRVDQVIKDTAPEFLCWKVLVWFSTVRLEGTQFLPWASEEVGVGFSVSEPSELSAVGIFIPLWCSLEALPGELLLDQRLKLPICFLCSTLSSRPPSLETTFYLLFNWTWYQLTSSHQFLYMHIQIQRAKNEFWIEYCPFGGGKQLSPFILLFNSFFIKHTHKHTHSSVI